MEPHLRRPCKNYLKSRKWNENINSDFFIVLPPTAICQYHPDFSVGNKGKFSTHDLEDNYISDFKADH